MQPQNIITAAEFLALREGKAIATLGATIPTTTPAAVRARGRVEESHGDSSEMNREELRYAHELARRKGAGEVAWWGFEAITLRLAKRTAYTPDFLVVLRDGTIEAHEVKALWKHKVDPTLDRVGWRDDARVKVKVAAHAFPWLALRATWRDRSGAWVFEQFDP